MSSFYIVSVGAILGALVIPVINLFRYHQVPSKNTIINDPNYDNLFKKFIKHRPYHKNPTYKQTIIMPTRVFTNVINQISPRYSFLEAGSMTYRSEDGSQFLLKGYVTDMEFGTAREVAIVCLNDENNTIVEMKERVYSGKDFLNTNAVVDTNPITVMSAHYKFPDRKSVV